MSEEHYWDAMPVEKLVAGYLRPHVIKRQMESDAETVCLLTKAIDCLEARDIPDSTFLAKLEGRGIELYEDGHYMTGKVMWAAHDRLNESSRKD